MAEQATDVIVVGAGQAGLATSYGLTQRGVEHVVLERGRVGETWRSQRWDSFRLNGPGWSNSLPGLAYPGDADAFDPADALADYFERYQATYDLPVRCGVRVTAVAAVDGGFRVETAEQGTWTAPHVVVAAGLQNVARVPRIAAELRPSLTQLDGLSYRSPSELPAGAVLVVGAAQTGGQVVEDLVQAGRRVFLATSRVGRIPRRYRGADIFRWLMDGGFYDLPLEDLDDPALSYAAQPQVSGAKGGRTLSYHEFARMGVTLLGRLLGADGDTLRFDDDLVANVEFADQFSKRICGICDGYIERDGVEAPPAEPDPAEQPEPSLLAGGAPTELDVAETGISSVIWCTGVGGDLSWLHVPVFDQDGRPQHAQGVAEVPGVYFVGFPWLARRGSGIIFGVGRDAEHIAEVIGSRLGAP